MRTTPAGHCDQQYQNHLKHLKLKGLQRRPSVPMPARAIRVPVSCGAIRAFKATRSA